MHGFGYRLYYLAFRPMLKGCHTEFFVSCVKNHPTTLPYLIYFSTIYMIHLIKENIF